MVRYAIIVVSNGRLNWFSGTNNEALLVFDNITKSYDSVEEAITARNCMTIKFPHHDFYLHKYTVHQEWKIVQYVDARLKFVDGVSSSTKEKAEQYIKDNNLKFAAAIRVK